MSSLLIKLSEKAELLSLENVLAGWSDRIIIELIIFGKSTSLMHFENQIHCMRIVPAQE